MKLRLIGAAFSSLMRMAVRRGATTNLKIANPPAVRSTAATMATTTATVVAEDVPSSSPDCGLFPSEVVVAGVVLVSSRVAVVSVGETVPVVVSVVGEEAVSTLVMSFVEVACVVSSTVVPKVVDVVVVDVVVVVVGVEDVGVVEVAVVVVVSSQKREETVMIVVFFRCGRPKIHVTLLVVVTLPTKRTSEIVTDSSHE